MSADPEGMTGPRLAAATLAAACVLVPATASASASDDEHVTWEQVRAALVAAHRPVSASSAPSEDGPHATPGPPSASAAPSAASAASGTTVSVTIPDLSWALDDATAPAGARRAACHQITGLDDETAAPLAACLAHVTAPTPGTLP